MPATHLPIGPGIGGGGGGVRGQVNMFEQVCEGLRVNK